MGGLPGWTYNWIPGASIVVPLAVDILESTGISDAAEKAGQEGFAALLSGAQTPAQIAQQDSKGIDAGTLITAAGMLLPMLMRGGR